MYHEDSSTEQMGRCIVHNQQKLFISVLEYRGRVCLCQLKPAYIFILDILVLNTLTAVNNCLLYTVDLVIFAMFYFLREFQIREFKNLAKFLLYQRYLSSKLIILFAYSRLRKKFQSHIFAKISSRKTYQIYSMSNMNPC